MLADRRFGDPTGADSTGSFHPQLAQGLSGRPVPEVRDPETLFSEDQGQFVDFLGQEGLGVPEINQGEVTDINHIEVGAG
jgi:hypothetical protein